MSRHDWRAFQLALMILVGMPLAGNARAATVAVIEIRAEIGKGLARYIDRALTDAESKAEVVVFDMHTPGGRVDAMGEIVNRIFDAKLPTIAYIRTEAISAGAVIALASSQIAMAPGATIGDAAPVSQAGEELGEKAVSYIRGKIRATAERNARNPDIAEAMVDKRKILIRRDDNYETLTPAELQELQASGNPFEIVSHEGELLTLTTDEALRIGFVETRAASLEDLLAAYSLVEDANGKRVMSRAQIDAAKASGAPEFRVIESLAGGPILRLNRSFAETLAISVTGSMLGSLLLSLGMVGLLIEMRTPGFGVPGIVGLVCIGLFFGGHLIADIDTSWGLIAFIFGLALLALEVFVIPGFGVAGFTGIALIAGGLLFVFGQSASSFSAALGSLGISLGVTIALAVVVALALPRTRAWNRLILGAEQTSELGYQAPRPELVALVGRGGVALTTLRPAGTADIDGQRVDVVSDGEFIPRNARVRVVQVEGGRVVVRPDAETANAT